jgi:hypothetical protein
MLLHEFEFQIVCCLIQSSKNSNFSLWSVLDVFGLSFSDFQEAFSSWTRKTQLRIFSFVTLAHPKGRGWRAAVQPPPPSGHQQKRNCKKHWFSRHDDIRGFKWFTLQSKSATEIGWCLVHWNAGKYNKTYKCVDVLLLHLALIFAVIQLHVGWEILTWFS